ncbi:MAG: histidine triad nucleotide-binding protein [Candidatus Doudnabacteria bacterium]|nr:histidine triad nucleotide-binding protein [Candidatus Doudnabacteria bacterium]
MEDCVFCNIVNKTIEAPVLLENDDLIVIRDILPKAPVHLLAIPKKHIVSVHHTKPEDELLMGKLVFAAKEMAEKFGVGETGYKLIFNVGRDGGMVIPHLHLHLLGGKKLPE